MPQPASQDTALTATYSSPTSAPFTIAESIPAPPSPLDLAGKSKNLESLRASLAAVQDQINRELTMRMEQDKAREAAVGARPSVDEEKEEENYGEEVQEGED
ncbi:gon7 family [Trichoderma cornu-damae]|uniref:EKC/KEOPS complex subunit GON7 n=1 Tax=Trichoderma cornu-damae TaxID=654480 RepID=A0A9P8TU57_9HYPO|nr:gon7 family [Trichoderma cornu-damae]